MIKTIVVVLLVLGLVMIGGGVRIIEYVVAEHAGTDMSLQVGVLGMLVGIVSWGFAGVMLTMRGRS